MVRTFSKLDNSAPVKNGAGFPARNHRIVQENTKKATSTPSTSPMMGLRNELKTQLMNLPFAAFAAYVCDLLRAEGYTNVRLAGRATYKGRSKEGGYDIEAFLPSPLSQKLTTGGGVLRRKVIVQVKQFKPGMNVYQRMLDELRGACLRTGAIEAVLITTSDFSPVIRDTENALRRQAGSGSLAPVHLLNGQALVERLIEHRIGVQKAKDALDATYFASLIDTAKIKKSNGDSIRDNGGGSPVPAACDRQPNAPTGLTLTLAFDISATLSSADISTNISSSGKGGA